MPSSLLQLSALAYRRADQLPPGSVLVVGGGQTGGQIVEDLLGAGREVYWSVSAVARMPRRYRGREIMEWLVDAGFFAAPLESIEEPAQLRAAQPIISGVGRYGHTLSLQWLAGKGATLLGRVTSVDGSVLSLDNSVASCIRYADGRSQEVRAQIDRGISARAWTCHHWSRMVRMSRPGRTSSCLHPNVSTSRGPAYAPSSGRRV